MDPVNLGDLANLEQIIGALPVVISSFYVAHVECVMVSVAYKPSETRGPVQYFVLSRAPIPDRPTLAEFAVRNSVRESCD